MIMFAGPDVSETIESIVSTLRESVALLNIIREQHEGSGRSSNTTDAETAVQNAMRLAADQIAVAFDGGNEYGGLSYHTDDGRFLAGRMNVC